MPHCTHCGSAIAPGANHCPSCGAAQARPAASSYGRPGAARPSPPPPPVGQPVGYATPAGYARQEYGVMHPPGVSGLGVAAIVLGGVALLFAWIPFCGAVIAWPVALIGLILGIIGWAVAHGSGHQGVGVPVTGTALCVLALVVPVASSSYFVRKANQVQQQRMNVPPPTVTTTPQVPTPPLPGVMHPATLNVGDFRVRMTSGESRPDGIVLRLEVRNTASVPVDFDLYGGRATLKDDAENVYAPRVDVERAADATTTVPPNGSIAYTMTFEPLRPTAESLRLAFPANGQTYTLKVPRRALKTVE